MCLCPDAIEDDLYCIIWFSPFSAWAQNPNLNYRARFKGINSKDTIIKYICYSEHEEEKIYIGWENGMYQVNAQNLNMVCLLYHNIVSMLNFLILIIVFGHTNKNIFLQNI